MRRIAIAGTITLALTFAACAAKQPPAPPPLNLVTEAEPKAQAAPAPPSAEQILSAQPSEVQQAIKEHDKSGDWQTYKTPAYTLYPYNQGPPPTVDCEPLRTSDIQLQPRETITDVAIGDSERWMATPASSGDPRDPVPHLAVKPQAPSIQTNLTIYTTKHIYHLLLRSRASHAMQEVEFYSLRRLTRESASDVISQILGRALRKKSQRGVSSEVRMRRIEPRAHARVGTQKPPQRSHRKFDLAERVLGGSRMRPFRQRRRRQSNRLCQPAHRYAETSRDRIGVETACGLIVKFFNHCLI
jgi:hypothetical protein